MLLYDSLLSKSYNQWGAPITSGLLGSQVRKSEVERFGQCCVQDVPVRCLEDKITIRNVFGSY